MQMFALAEKDTPGNSYQSQHFTWFRLFVTVHFTRKLYLKLITHLKHSYKLN